MHFNTKWTEQFTSVQNGQSSALQCTSVHLSGLFLGPSHHIRNIKNCSSHINQILFWWLLGGVYIIFECGSVIDQCTVWKTIEEMAHRILQLFRGLSTFLCLTLSFLIVNPLILQTTFWCYRILVSFSTIFKLGLPAKVSLWIKNVFSSIGSKIWSLVYTRLE